MKGLYFTDTHDQGRNPGARTDDYHHAILEKFKELINRAINDKVDFIIHGGDWFETPRVAYSLYNQHQRLLRKARKAGIKIFLVPGNHDLYGYSMDTLHQTAIGALAQSGLVTLLTSKRKPVILQGNGFTLALHGKEYHKDIDNDPANDYYIEKVADYDFLISHGMLLKKPFHPDVRYTLTKDVVTEADLVLNGHYHPGYDLHDINGTTFGNVGSTARDEASQDNMKRIPQYAVLTIDKDGWEAEFVEYTCAAKGSDIFDRTHIVQKADKQRYLEAFEQTIDDAINFESFDPKDILAKAIGIDAQVIKEALDAIVSQEKVAHDGKLDGYIEKQKIIGIKSIELENFQSHKKTKVEFNETGLNAITGASDSGKSAIIRALRWVFYNEPKGTDFIRHGTKRATVTVVFTDGSSITRSRTNSSSGEYIVRDANGNETEFKGFGANLPIDIANTHQMPKVELATGVERPLNFSYQLDGHFLLSDSPAVRANAIGRLTGVHLVDAAIKEKSKDIRQLTIASNAAEKQLDELDEQLKAYEDIDQEEKDLNVLKGLLMTAENLEQEIEDDKTLLHEYSEATGDMFDLKHELSKYALVDRGLLVLEKAQQLHREIGEFKDLQSTYKKEKELVSTLKMDLTDYEDIDEGIELLEKAKTLQAELKELKELESEYDMATGDVMYLTEKCSKYDNLKKIDLQKIQDLRNEIDELRTLNKEHEIASKEIIQLNDTAHKNEVKQQIIHQRLTELMEKSGNKCPVCRQAVTGDTIEEMLHHA